MSTFDDMRELRDDLEMAEAGGLPAWLTTRTKLGRELQALARKHYTRWVTAELQLVTLRADAEKAREATDAERATNERLTTDVERLRALPVIATCDECGWSRDHDDAPGERAGRCAKPGARHHAARDIYTDKPPPAWCPLRGAR